MVMDVAEVPKTLKAMSVIPTSNLRFELVLKKNSWSEKG